MSRLRRRRGWLRRALGNHLVAAGLWAAGNALTAGTLLLYLALDLGASGLTLSWVLAAPALGGLLRLFAPWAIVACGGVKRATLYLFLLAYLLLLGQPLATAPHPAGGGLSLTALVALVCVHQLLEYLAQACLWSWIGDLAPRRLRGRYIALREVVQLVVMIPTLFASGLFADRWRAAYLETRPDLSLAAYGLPAALGAALLLASLVPLARTPVRPRQRAARSLAWSQLAAPLRDAQFRSLLRFGVWVAAANGLTQAAQNIYPRRVLGFGAADMAALRTTMRLGQAAVSPAVGVGVDRFGARPVMLLSQLFVATGPLFFLLASPSYAWPLAGAWIVWSAFAGLNIGLPAACLGYSKGDQQAAYVATYFGVGGAVYAIATVAGGAAFDWCDRNWPALFAEATAPPVTHWQVFFAAGLVGRLLGALWMARVQEPGAATLPEMAKSLVRRRNERFRKAS